LFWAFGPAYFLRYHRWITHSFVAAPFLSLFVSIVVYSLSNFKNFLWIWLASLAGISSHICFDMLTSYGTQIFAPLSNKKYAFDLIFVFDPVLTIGGIAAILLIRRFKTQAFFIASVLLFYVISYISLCFLIHERAVQMAKAEFNRMDIKVEEVSVFPSLFWPLRWRAVARGGEEYYLLEYPAGTMGTYRVRKVPVFKVDSLPARLMEYDEIRAFLEFARYPAINKYKKENYQILEFFDMRFSDYKGRNAMVLELKMDTDGSVTSIRIR
ncbi:MAG: metal-dependent hydrolase, partial [Candidatus Aenigmatarchaeota archaeon]